jgi:hypothetical protein
MPANKRKNSKRQGKNRSQKTSYEIGGGKEGERAWQTETLIYAGPHAFAFPCTPI